MFEGWDAQRWETPLSNSNEVSFVELIDGAESTLIVVHCFASEDDREGTLWRVSFPEECLYQSIPEGLRLGLWTRGRTTAETGNTRIIVNSPWIEAMRVSQPLFDHSIPDAVHYQVVTTHEVLDVITSKAPTFERAEPNDGSCARRKH